MKKLLIFGLVLVLAFGLTACSGDDSATSENAKISGKIEGVSSGKVKIGDKSSKIKNGAYSLKGIKQGKKEMKVVVDGVTAYKQKINLKENTIKNIEEDSVYNFLYEKYDVKKINKEQKKVDVYKPKTIREFVHTMESIENVKSEYTYELTPSDLNLDNKDIKKQGVEYNYQVRLHESEEIDESKAGEAQLNLYATAYIHSDSMDNETITDCDDIYMSITGDFSKYKLVKSDTSYRISSNEKTVTVNAIGTIQIDLLGGYMKRKDVRLRIYYSCY